MTSGSQTGDGLEDFGAWRLPQAVGVLTLCGYEQADALRSVRRSFVKALSGGIEGGSAAARTVEHQLLLSASAPRSPRPPADGLERALAGLPWAERLATVVSIVPGLTQLGEGRPAEVAAAVGARVPGWAPPGEDTRPTLAEVVTAAVAARACPPQPGLLAEASAATKSQQRRVVLAAALVVVALVVALVVLASRAGSSDSTRGFVAEDFPITQWVAVLDTGPDPASLAPEARDLGRSVGVYVFTDRWSCYRGFPDGPPVADDGWFLGLAANDKAVVDDLLAQIGRAPLLEARVRQVCVQQPPDGGGPVVVDP